LCCQLKVGYIFFRNRRVLWVVSENVEVDRKKRCRVNRSLHLPFQPSLDSLQKVGKVIIRQPLSDLKIEVRWRQLWGRLPVKDLLLWRRLNCLLITPTDTFRSPEKYRPNYDSMKQPNIHNRLHIYIPPPPLRISLFYRWKWVTT